MTDRIPASGPQPDPYNALLARLRSQQVPFSVMWELTHRCNLRCVMCYNVPTGRRELSTDECLDVLAQLAEAGTLRLTFTGGEILMRRDFFAIAGRARALGFALDLKTNGVLITPAIAEQIADLDPVELDLSLLAATPERSDAIMGGRDTLPAILRAARLLRERGVRVRFNTLLLDLNLSEREALLDLAARFGVYYQQTFKISPGDDGNRRAECHQLSVEAMAAVLAADRTPLRTLDCSPDGRTCLVGLASCLIAPDGIVYPCVELRIPAGDLRRQRFAEVWAAAPILRQLREQHVRANLSDCRACALADCCEGRCAGLAWKEHGDPYAGHTLACWHAQARYLERHPGQAIPETSYLARQKGGRR